MSDDMSEMINNVKKMVDSGNIPDNLKEIIGNLNSSNNNNISSNDISSMLSSMLNSNNSNSNSHNNDFNIDMNTILKMKSIIETMNKKDDPRANLLYSLKPYLRDSKKDKLDQYVNLLNMSKLADIMKKENNNNA